MASNAYIDVIDPQMHVKREAAGEHDCRILEILMSDGNMVTLHFVNMEALQAFVGLTNIVVGNINGN